MRTHVARLVAQGVLGLAISGSAQNPAADANARAPYRDFNLPVDERVRDLLGRMTLEEKARQLDLYAGVPDLVDKAADNVHAAPDAKFCTEEAKKLFGVLGVGAIHDLYAQPALANEIQRWGDQAFAIGHSSAIHGRRIARF